MCKYTGLRFQKFDLHVHTPASHDFPDKKITPEQIIKQALDKNLRGIAITDHNTGQFIDRLKEAAKGTKLVIFPGVEIYCTGGKSGIHIIGLLNTDKGTKHIDGLLSKLNINPDDFGTKKAVTEFSPYQVIEAINSEPYNGIAVLAHCTSSKGVLHDMTGEIRRKIFEHPGLLAVEASEYDFKDSTKISKHTRAVDLLNGSNPDYNFRKLGVYISSDSKCEDNSQNHSIEGIGEKYTFFKVDDSVDLESLRQCFIDREVRIRQFFEFKENQYPYIKKIAVSGGFFDQQDASFHQGLNSILGGKGAGKSLLIELIRFALDQPSSQDEIYDDHIRKLQKRLETYGVVNLSLIDETGVEQNIERTFNPSENNPFNNESDEQIVHSFPILVLSQNEIIRIAEDETEQIKFIDRFFDFRHFQNRINNLERDLEKLDVNFAEGLRAIKEKLEIQKQLKKNKAELEKLNKLLSDPIYNKFKNFEAKDRSLVTQKDWIISIKNHLSEELEYIRTLQRPSFDAELSMDPVIKRNNDTIANMLQEIEKYLISSTEESEKASKNIEIEYKKWNSNYIIEKKKYEEHIRSSGGDKKELEGKRLRVLREIEDLNKRLSNLQKQIENLKQIRDERDKLIKTLFSIYDEYSNERKQKCKKFENESNQRLKINIQESTNIDEFKNELLSLKRGSYLKDSEIEDICNSISAYDFILYILRYEASNDINTLEPIGKETSIDLQKVRVLSDYLLNEIPYEKLLRLQYHAHPQDRPEIKFQLSPEKYENIRDISVGQKCTAMLIMALSDGNFPILIDQPEDSLDVRSIWEDMCIKIRKGKELRQFVFTTHNSSLAVASDTDKFIIIQSDANRGEIIFSGAIDTPKIKSEVIDYLEGGPDTYETKAMKYGHEIKKHS